MRTVLLPTKGPTHLLGMWLKFFERWQGEVDTLRLHVNNATHGVALKKLVAEAPGEYLLLMENDGIIFKPGFVDRYFSLLEQDKYDVIGSPRMSCASQLAEAARVRWDLDYAGEGDKGPSFWPNFFFVKKSLLLETDMHFEAKGWKPGDKISILNHEVQTEPVAGDTFVWMSFQIRNLIPKHRILEIPQYHASPFDLQHKAEGKGLWDGLCDRVHIGSMTGDITVPNSEIEQLEAERRTMWHMFCEGTADMVSSDVWEKLDLERIHQWWVAYEELLDYAD